MDRSRNFFKPSSAFVASTLALLLTAAAPAQGDRIVRANTNHDAGGIAYDDVRIRAVLPATDLLPAQIQYVYKSSDNTRLDLKDIWIVELDDDAAFNEAEHAYRAGKADQYDNAVDNYQKAVRGGSDWKIRYVVPRLLELAEKTKRFDASLTAYLALVRVDPVAAGKIQLTLPARGSRLLDDAAQQIESALARLTGDRAAQDAQSLAYLKVLLEVQTARDDQAALVKVADRLEGLLKNSQGDEQSGSLLASIRLSQARARLAERKYDEALKLIDANAQRFEDPAQQALAMFLIAECKAGLAKPDDRAAQLDTAIAYLRVVSHFHDTEGKPFVADALLKAAGIEASLKDLDAAGKLYQSAIDDFPDSPQSDIARQKLADLKK